MESLKDIQDLERLKLLIKHKGMDLARHGDEYFLCLGTGPMDFVELLHIKLRGMSQRIVLDLIARYVISMKGDCHAKPRLGRSCSTH